LLRIDEVVDHRNAVTHGRETPDKIGRMYSRAEVVHRIAQMKSVCLLLISATEAHCANTARHRRK
jgi:hypothetical protein